MTTPNAWRDSNIRADKVPNLPPYRGVVVVDTKEFGSNPDSTQHKLADHIPSLVARAFDRADLSEIWENALFPHNTGDGYAIGFESTHLPAVVARLFNALQDVLSEQDELLRRQSRYTRLRMRASINVGPVRDLDPDQQTAVVGSTVIAAHRMVDAQPVRDLLTRSDPDQTYIAAALSQRVYEDVVASGFAQLPKSKVVPTKISIKELTETIYLYVPTPSGDLLRTGFTTDTNPHQPKISKTPPPAINNSTNTITGGRHKIAIQVGHLHGGLHTNQPDPE